MRNVSSRPHDSPSNKINFLSEKEPNYAASRNKKPAKGLPIPIPQNPTCDYSSAGPRITSRMQRKDGSTQHNTNNSIIKHTRGTAVSKDNNMNHIPTRKSNRVSPREDGNVIVITDEEDENNALSTTQVSSTRLSAPRVPSTRLSSTQAPSTRLSSTQAPSTRLSPTQAPSRQAPSTRLSPSRQAPSTRLSPTQAPSTQLSPPHVTSTRLPSPRVASTRLPSPRVAATRLSPPQAPSARLSPPPVSRKRRIIQRDNSSSSENESDSDKEKGKDNIEKRMAKKLRNERNQRRQEENDRKEERSEEKSPIPSRKPDFRYSQPTISSLGKRKDYSTISSMIASVKKVATAVNIATGRKLPFATSPSPSPSPSRSPTPPPPTRKTPPSPMNHIYHKKPTTIPTPHIESPKEDKRSFIDKQKDMMKARLQQRLNSNEAEAVPVQRKSSRPVHPLPKQRNPYQESQTSANARPSLGESVLRTSSVYQLPVSLQPNYKPKPLPANKEKSIQNSEDESSEYEDALSELVESTPEEAPEPPDDPIDHIPIKPIGVDQHILTYPFGGKKSVTLYAKDLDRLEEGHFLNDSLLDIFPKIWADQNPNASAHTFSSFFYTKLAGDGSSINYDKIERWTARVNIFEKKLIIIPVAQNNHWYLVVVTNPGLAIKNRKQYGLNLPIDNADENELENENSGVEELSSKPRLGRKVKNIKAGTKLDSKKPYIMVFDSLGGNRYETCKNTAEYLKKEAMKKLKVKEEDFVEPEFVHTSCPNQKNLVDCGVFCLHYMNSLYQDTERMMDLLYNNLRYDKGWDNEETLPTFRLILKRIAKRNILQYREFLKKSL